MDTSPAIRQYLFELTAKRRNYQQEIKTLVSQYQYVVFYGCGSMFHSVIDTWNAYISRKIDYCCDTDSRKWGNQFRGIECISPQELIKLKDKCAVFVTMDHFAPVYQALQSKGFPCVNTLYLFDIIASEYLAGQEQSGLVDNLCRTYELLTDQHSKEVFSAIVTRVFDRGANVFAMADVCGQNQYFPADIVKLSEHESFADIGGFDGDTIKDFIIRTQGKFDNVFSFEMNEVNYRLLSDNVKKMPQQEKIKIYNLGAWDSECDIAYSIGDSSSSIGRGDGRGHAVPLDELLQQERITFLKMDIEGAETNALRGVQNIIRNQKPTLAVCIYHDLKHLWEIPLYLKGLVPEYSIFLRHYTHIERETVCYATIK